MTEKRSRRAVLRTGAVAGLGIAGAVAGCSQLDSLTGGTDSTADGTTDQDTPGRYRRWLPAPAAFNTEGYYFEAVDYETLQANESHFDASVYSDYAESDLFEELNLPLDAVESSIFIGPITNGVSPTVVLGEFAAGDVTGRLTELGYEQRRESGEYAVYAGESAIGVTDGRLVFSNDGDEDWVEAILAAERGDEPSYAEESEEMERLLNSVESGTFVYGTTHDPTPPEDADPADGVFAGTVGFGYQDTVTGETTDTKIVVLFESEADVDMDAVSTYTNGDLFAEYQSVSSTRDGRVVVITGETPTNTLYDY